MPRMVAPSSEALQDAAHILRAGGLVAMPTETVYGLAANALDGAAVARIFAAKGRPSFNPLIVHVPDLSAAEKYGVFNAYARAAANAFWPGPLTIIVPRVAECPVSDLCSAGLPTLALRVPGHAVARDLLRVCDVPLAAPSANKSGSISPTTPAHVADSLGDDVDMIVAAGMCDVGLESTVLDVSGDVPVVLRPGAITAEDISRALGVDVGYDFGDHETVKSPGQLLRHYAPGIPLRMRAVDVAPGEALLAFGSTRFMGVQGGGAANDLPDHAIRNLSESGDLYEAAANLFRMMRELDDPRNTGIAVMDIPNQGVGVAVNDRLRRAAAGSVQAAS